MNSNSRNEYYGLINDPRFQSLNNNTVEYYSDHNYRNGFINNSNNDSNHVGPSYSDHCYRNGFVSKSNNNGNYGGPTYSDHSYRNGFGFVSKSNNNGNYVGPTYSDHSYRHGFGFVNKSNNNGNYVGPTFSDHSYRNGFVSKSNNNGNYVGPTYSNHGCMNGVRLQQYQTVSMGSEHVCNESFNGGSYDSTTACGLTPNGCSSSDLLYSVPTGVHLENVNDDCDFSDSVLRFISQILVEEDVEGKGCMLQESLEHQALQDVEKSLYNVSGNDFDTNPFMNPNVSFDLTSEGLDCYFRDSYCDYGNGVGGGSTSLWVDPNLGVGLGDFSASDVGSTFPGSNQILGSSLYSSGSIRNVIDGFVDSSIRTVDVPDFGDENQSVSQFMKGAEEAGKLLPDCSDLIVRVDTQCQPSVSTGLIENDLDLMGSRGKKHWFTDDLRSDEERSSKQVATCDEWDVKSDMFDKVLLHHAGDANELIASLRTTLQMGAIKKTPQNGQGSGGTKGRGKKHGGSKEVVDLRTLLINCAQAVAVDDRNTANELLKQIRQHSDPLGDGNQRLAHYLANGLEARLAGTGSQIYKALTSQRISAADVLNAYLLYLAACPFRRLSNFFSNKNIAKRTRKCARIHIIDFGILYGFQWPTFIQRQSMREGGPPKIRITGIDFPQPGFRPAERVEETGRRLERYAQEFKVPFEYRAIAKRWDAIQPEDFEIEEGEVLIVNCIYRMKNLPDETLSVESSRNKVLKMIRKLNPELFIHGVVNGAYNAPFFVTRFREALFHFSAQFDMLEAIVPREYCERMLIERDLLAREALNVIACEGWERVERPETYKQWQVRTMKSGFTQLPLDTDIKDRAMQQVRSVYNKNFVIDEDSRWLLLGWKGRIIFALSTWKPV